MRGSHLWPRCIVGELRKLGIPVAKCMVEKYRVRLQNPPSPTWKAFLKNRVQDLVFLDFFVVPTLTHGVGVLDSFIGATVLTHHLILATLNTKHFASFPGLHIERPY